MSAQIYSALDSVKVPTFSFGTGQTIEDHNKAMDKYKVDLKKELNRMGYNGKNVGEVIKFQVADGYAQYMVISMRPLRLMHLPLIDSYEFNYVHLMTTKEVNDQIEANKKWEELFK